LVPLRRSAPEGGLGRCSGTDPCGGVLHRGEQRGIFMRKNARAAVAASPERFRAKAAATARRERTIQRRIDRTDRKAAAQKQKPQAMQAGARI
jgi:hypothetical protein